MTGSFHNFSVIHCNLYRGFVVGGVFFLFSFHQQRYVEPLAHLDKSEYQAEEMTALKKVLDTFDDLTSREIIKKYFNPELQQGKIHAVTKTLIEF